MFVASDTASDILADVRGVEVDEVWCQGDICHGGPWPRE